MIVTQRSDGRYRVLLEPGEDVEVFCTGKPDSLKAQPVDAPWPDDWGVLVLATASEAQP